MSTELKQQKQRAVYQFNSPDEVRQRMSELRKEAEIERNRLMSAFTKLSDVQCLIKETSDRYDIIVKEIDALTDLFSKLSLEWTARPAIEARNEITSLKLRIEELEGMLSKSNGNNCSSRGAKRGRKYYTMLDKQMALKYYKDGMSYTEIALQMGPRRGTIKRWIEELTECS